MTEGVVQVYVPLLDEGTDTLRPTMAEKMGGDIYKLLPTFDYDPEDEAWEFLPGSLVRCKEGFGERTKSRILVVYERAE